MRSSLEPREFTWISEQLLTKLPVNRAKFCPVYAAIPLFLQRFEVSAEGQVEIEAILDSLVAKANQAPPGVYSPPLGFQDLEHAGALDAESQVALGGGLGKAGLTHLDEEEGLLLKKGAIGLQGGLHFAEGPEDTLDVVLHGGLVALEGGPCLGGGSPTAVDGLRERRGNRPSEIGGVERAFQVARSIATGTGKPERWQKVFAGGVSAAGGGVDARASGDEIGSAGE